MTTSADGRWVAVRDRPEQLSLVERATGRVTDRVEAGERTMSAKFSPDSRLLATACCFQGGGHGRVDAVEAAGRLTRVWKLDRSDYKTRTAQFIDLDGGEVSESASHSIEGFNSGAPYADERDRPHIWHSRQWRARRYSGRLPDIRRFDRASTR
jgi:hypothetical protein